MIKAVLLDYWGVIQVDRSVTWAEEQIDKFPSVRQVLDDLSAKIDLDQITITQYYQELATAVHSTATAVETELMGSPEINHPLLRLADKLRATGINVSLLSNDGSYLRAEMEAQHIAQHFDTIFLSGEIGAVKPDVRIYTYAAQQLKLDPSEIIFFDDRQTNIDGALRAGMQAELYISVSQVRQLLSDLL